ncbi:hypothetical protein ACFLSX_05105 [Calditrichota bacterium]
MRPFSLLFSLITLILIFNIFSCDSKKKSPTESQDNQPQSALEAISSNEGGTLSTLSGYGMDIIPGTVPLNQNDQAASISFSVESPVEPPIPLPAGASLISNITKNSPESFTFRWPVRMFFPYPAEVDASSLSVIHYDALLERWRLIPSSHVDAGENVIGADALELGFNAIVSITNPNPKISGATTNGSGWGGFKMQNPSWPDYYYTLTVKSVTNFAYPWQEEWFAGQIVGSTGCTGVYLGSPLTFTSILLPQASYEIWVSYTTGQPPFTIYTYTTPAVGTVTGEVTYGTAEPFGSGWTPLAPPGGGVVEGTPADWPQPNTTFGTGAFQATLNWVNNATHTTDMDLHIYGPNNMHVYFGDKVSADSTVQLDRDWLSGWGNAVENIFSIGTMPSGSYTLKVHRYSGDATNFNVRVIRSGNVVSYPMSVTADNSQEITVTTFTL